MVTIDGFIDKGAYSVEQWLTKQEVKKALKIDGNNQSYKNLEKELKDSNESKNQQFL